MYNKTKRGLWLATAILAIVFGAISIISSIRTIAIELEWFDEFIDSVGYSIGIVIALLLEIAFVIFGIILLQKPKKLDDSTYVWNKKCMVTLVVLTSVIIFLLIIALNILDLILYLALLGLAIASLAIKDKTANLSAKESGQDKVFNEKMLELKKLKELHVITDEQFKESSDKLFDEYKNSL